MKTTAVSPRPFPETQHGPRGSPTTKTCRQVRNFGTIYLHGLERRQQTTPVDVRSSAQQTKECGEEGDCCVSMYGICASVRTTRTGRTHRADQCKMPSEKEETLLRRHSFSSLSHRPREIGERTQRQNQREKTPHAPRSRGLRSSGLQQPRSIGFSRASPANSKGQTPPCSPSKTSGQVMVVPSSSFWTPRTSSACIADSKFARWLMTSCWCLMASSCCVMTSCCSRQILNWSWEG